MNKNLITIINYVEIFWKYTSMSHCNEQEQKLVSYLQETANYKQNYSRLDIYLGVWPALSNKFLMRILFTGG